MAQPTAVSRVVGVQAAAFEFPSVDGVVVCVFGRAVAVFAVVVLVWLVADAGGVSEEDGASEPGLVLVAVAALG